MYRSFTLILLVTLGCDQPAPEDVIADFCKEHPNYQACSEATLEEQLIAFCLEHPEFTVCQMKQPDTDPPTDTEETANNVLQASGTLDEPARRVFNFLTTEVVCELGRSVNDRAQFGIVVNDQGTDHQLLLALQEDVIAPGIYELEPEEDERAPWITAFLGIPDYNGMQTRGPVMRTRSVAIESMVGVEMSGLFLLTDLCALPDPNTPPEEIQKEPACTGELIGRFSCVAEVKSQP